MKKILFMTIVSAAIAVASYTPIQASLVVPTSGTSPKVATITKEEAMKNALKEFKSLSRKERNARLKEAKAVLKKYKADKKAGNSSTDANTVLLVILAILLPPLAVYLKEKAANGKFILDLILWLAFAIGIFAFPILGWICALAAFIYALVVVLSN
jgi:uncharacterized membrane protein YqaE (UPF0057 family)